MATQLEEHVQGPKDLPDDPKALKAESERKARAEEIASEAPEPETIYLVLRHHPQPVRVFGVWETILVRIADEEGFVQFAAAPETPGRIAVRVEDVLAAYSLEP